MKRPLTEWAQCGRAMLTVAVAAAAVAAAVRAAAVCSESPRSSAIWRGIPTLSWGRASAPAGNPHALVRSGRDPCLENPHALVHPCAPSRGAGGALRN